MDIIDADGHIVEKDSDLRGYLPEPHSKRSGSLLPSDGQDSLMGGRLGGLEDNDIPTRLSDMDTEGIGISVLFPTTSFRVSQVMEREYALSYCRAYNDFISDVCKRNPRLKGIGLVPFQNICFSQSAVVGEVNPPLQSSAWSGLRCPAKASKNILGRKFIGRSTRSFSA